MNEREIGIIIPAEITKVVETKVFAACPFCKKKDAFQVDHLLGKEPIEFGPWYCDDCGRGYTGRIVGDGYVTLNPATASAGTKKKPTLVVLRVRDTEIMAVVSGFRIERGDESADERAESNRYFYEEHTCSTNIVRDVLMFYAWLETDPHGVFEYVGEVEATNEMIDAVRKCDPPEAVRALLRNNRSPEEK